VAVLHLVGIWPNLWNSVPFQHIKVRGTDGVWHKWYTVWSTHRSELPLHSGNWVWFSHPPHTCNILLIDAILKATAEWNTATAETDACAQSCALDRTSVAPKTLTVPLSCDENLTLLAPFIFSKLIAYFLWYDTGHIENDASNNSFIVACVFVTAVTFLPRRCLATIGGFLPKRCQATIGGFLPSRCPATIGWFFAQPLPSKDKGIFTEALPSNDKEIHIQTHRLMGGIF
jgi:hypothetical protein